MESFNFKNSFREEMSSEEALHTYVKLLKSVPENQQKALEDAYLAIASVISRRECEKVKEGWMF